jgi:hypothetical protein
MVDLQAVENNLGWYLWGLEKRLPALLKVQHGQLYPPLKSQTPKRQDL